MKTLSVRQPWANLIVYGIKDIENRTWRTKFRGRIYIHAPAKIDKDPNVDTPMRIKAMRIFYRNNHDKREDFLNNTWGPLWDNQFTSSIIGSVEIVDCIRDSKSVWADPDCWHWVLKDPILFDNPILNVKGKLSLWEYVA